MAISKIKQWVLDKSPSGRKVSIQDKLKIKLSKVGIVAHVQNSNDLSCIEKFVRNNESMGHTVHCLLFSESKELTHDCILDRKNIKWTGEPKGEKVTDFLSREFDILYCPTKVMEFPLEHIVKRSASIMKVGVYSKQTEPYMDICIDTKTNNISSILNEIDVILKNLLKNG